MPTKLFYHFESGVIADGHYHSKEEKRALELAFGDEWGEVGDDGIVRFQISGEPVKGVPVQFQDIGIGVVYDRKTDSVILDVQLNPATRGQFRVKVGDERFQDKNQWMFGWGALEAALINYLHLGETLWDLIGRVFLLPGVVGDTRTPITKMFHMRITKDRKIKIFP